MMFSKVFYRLLNTFKGKDKIEKLQGGDWTTPISISEMSHGEAKSTLELGLRFLNLVEIAEAEYERKHLISLAKREMDPYTAYSLGRKLFRELLVDLKNKADEQ